MIAENNIIINTLINKQNEKCQAFDKTFLLENNFRNKKQGYK